MCFGFAYAVVDVYDVVELVVVLIARLVGALMTVRVVVDLFITWFDVDAFCRVV